MSEIVPHKTPPAPTSFARDIKRLADAMWEDAVRFADALAPDVPTDTEPLDEFMQFQILMGAAAEFSPGYWDDPDALLDLWRLKKKFLDRDDQQLVAYAKLARAQRKGLPDPMMTPENPEWEKQIGG